jgi:hypothetical protein
MAYQQTTASSMDDVCAQIVTFAVANAGFTNAGTITVNTKTIQRLLKGGIYYYFGSHNTFIGQSANVVKYSLGYTASAGFPTTANGPEFQTSYWTFQSFAGPYTNLFLFTEGTCVHAVVEMTNGIFNHFSFGKMTKTDSSIDGGEYMTAGAYAYFSGGIYQPWTLYQNGNCSPWLSNGRANAATAAYPSYMLHRKASPFNDFRDFAMMGTVRNNLGCFPNGSWGSWNDVLVQRSPNAGTQRSVMLRNFVALHDSVSGLQKIAGYIPGMRVLSMKNLDDKEIIYTNWQVFPVTQHNGNNINIPSSGEFALAYQRV